MLVIESLLVETTSNESDDDLRAVIDQMLSCVWDPPQTDWWHQYDFGRVFEFSSRQFREFICPAGSVTAHLFSRAEKTDLYRALILVGADEHRIPAAKIIAKSQSQSLNPNELRHVRPESS
jgi:hypothetical protein